MGSSLGGIKFKVNCVWYFAIYDKFFIPRLGKAYKWVVLWGRGVEFVPQSPWTGIEIKVCPLICYMMTNFSYQN